MIENLLKEHGLILRYAKLLGRLVQNQDIPNYPDILKKYSPYFLKFFSRYLKAFHQEKEEHLLSILSDGDEKTFWVRRLSVMKEEHCSVDKILKNIEEAFQNERWASFSLYANKYGQIISEHIYKEENVMIPLIKDAIPPRKLDEIKSEMLKVEKALVEQRNTDIFQIQYEELNKNIKSLSAKTV